MTTSGLVAGALALVHAGASARDPDACDIVDVDYAITTNLQIRGTRLGAGDGVYPSGSGTLRLRLDGAPSSRVRAASLRAYDTRGRVTIVSKALLWATRVVSDARTTVRGGDAATGHGTLRDGVLGWTTKVAGYRTDGTVTCDGSFCGRFGAPPPGASPLHDGPYEVDLNPFVFSPDGKTFTMGYALVSHTPDQSSYIAISGRESGRSCVAEP